MTTNIHEEAARERKATKIANVLAARGATSFQASKLDAAGRRTAELLAVVNQGSEATWVLVAEILCAREQARAAAMADDPFDLIPQRRSA